VNTEPTDRSDALAGDPEGEGQALPRPEDTGAHLASADPEPFDTSIESLRESARRRGEKADATRAFWKELPVLVVVALFVAVLIKTFLVQAFYIPSGSMRDTLEVGDRVMVNKLAYRFGDPATGDVIVFDSPLVDQDRGENLLGAIVRNVGEALGLSTPESALIKRVIAVGGDTLEIDGNRLYVNGDALDEPYLTRNVRMSDYGPIEIPANHVFVMGDNRNQSEDSRVFGPIHESTIIGRAFVKVWPPGRWGGL
jgi:signal peptidase I